MSVHFLRLIGLQWAKSLGHALSPEVIRDACFYGGSALLHVVVLGGLAYWAPSGDSGPSFSMGRGDGGLGSEYAPIGSAGGAPLTAVFHFELPPATAVESAVAPVEAEVPSKPVAANSTAPEEVTAPTPIAMALSVRREPEAPDVKAPAATLETDIPPSET